MGNDNIDNIDNIEGLAVGDLAANCWFYETAEGCVLIDPGGSPQAILSRLARNGRHVTSVLLTHGHFDHVGALGTLMKEPLFVGTEICIHEADAAYLGEAAFETQCASWRAVNGDSRFIEERWLSLPAATRLLKEGDVVGTGAAALRVLHTPGHSAGSVCYYNEENRVLFTGDTLFKHAVGRVDLPGGSPSALRESIARLLSLPASTRCYPGHGETTTIGSEAARYGC